jgi:hypothetical protein
MRSTFAVQAGKRQKSGSLDLTGLSAGEYERFCVIENLRTEWDAIDEDDFKRLMKAPDTLSEGLQALIYDELIACRVPINNAITNEGEVRTIAVYWLLTATLCGPKLKSRTIVTLTQSQALEELQQSPQHVYFLLTAPYDDIETYFKDDDTSDVIGTEEPSDEARALSLYLSGRSTRVVRHAVSTMAEILYRRIDKRIEAGDIPQAQRQHKRRSLPSNSSTKDALVHYKATLAELRQSTPQLERPATEAIIAADNILDDIAEEYDKEQAILRRAVWLTGLLIGALVFYVLTSGWAALLGFIAFVICFIYIGYMVVRLLFLSPKQNDDSAQQLRDFEKEYIYPLRREGVIWEQESASQEQPDT